jgi:hypothetical protein
MHLELPAIDRDARVACRHGAAETLSPQQAAGEGRGLCIESINEDSEETKSSDNALKRAKAFARLH